MNESDVKLETFFPYRLAVAAESFSRTLTEVYGRKFGLSREEWRLLFLLAREDSMSSLDLTRRTTLDKVQVSRASQRLEDKGLITREVAAKDRRLRIYTCTDEGRTLFDEALPQVEERTKEVLSRMSESEFQALECGLNALSDAIKEQSNRT